VNEEREEAIHIAPDMLAEPERQTRIDFERGMRAAPPLILVLIAANVAVFAWELATGALASRERLIQAGALVRELVVEGESWRLISATFLHAGWDHLFGNCLMLYIVGMACEHAFGPVRTAVALGLQPRLLSAPPPG
jgi:rhomboid protease GluP